MKCLLFIAALELAGQASAASDSLNNNAALQYRSIDLHIRALETSPESHLQRRAQLAGKPEARPRSQSPLPRPQNSDRSRSQSPNKQPSPQHDPGPSRPNPDRQRSFMSLLMDPSPPRPPRSRAAHQAASEAAIQASFHAVNQRISPPTSPRRGRSPTPTNPVIRQRIHAPEHSPEQSRGRSRSPGLLPPVRLSAEDVR